MLKPPPSLDDTGPSAPPRLAAAASLRKAVTQHVKWIPLPRWFRQPSCYRSTEQQRADLRSSRTRACARLTARLSIGGRNSSASGAGPVSLTLRPACGECAPALPFAVQSPRCDSVSFANVGVSVLSDGNGHSADAVIIHAAQPDVGGRRRRLYLAVRSVRPATCVFIPPTIRRNPPEAPNLQATELRQDKSRKVRPGRRPEERPNISALPRCAVLNPEVRIRESRANAGLLAHRADCQSHDRNVSRSRALLGHSRCRCGGSQWPHRKATRFAGWSA
jgi:hypothetical protein